MSWKKGPEIIARIGYLLLALLIGALYPVALWVCVMCGLYQTVRQQRSKKIVRVVPGLS